MKLIVFEGTDGTGKTTHAKTLTEHLHDVEGYTVTYLKAPIRIDEDDIKDMHPRDRYEEYLNDMWRVQKKIRMFEIDGVDIVIMDRYTWSLMVYQSGDEVPMDYIKHDLQEMQVYQPDLTFLLTTDRESITKRLSNRTDSSIYEKSVEQVISRTYDYLKLSWETTSPTVLVSTTQHFPLTDTLSYVINTTIEFLSENS